MTTNQFNCIVNLGIAAAMPWPGGVVPGLIGIIFYGLTVWDTVVEMKPHEMEK